MTFDYESLRARFRLHVPQRANLASQLLDRHARRGAQPALIFADEQGTTSRWSYRQLSELSNRLGNVFRQLGINPGDPVAILLSASVEIYLCYLAAFKLGAIAVPISTLFGVEGVEYRIRHSGARVVVTVPEARPTLAKLRDLLRVFVVGKPEGNELSFAQQVERASPRLRKQLTAPEEPVLLIYSSGTTGPPKGVVHTRRSLTHTIATEKTWTGMQPTDCHWNVADPSWLGGVMTDLLCAWPVGATVFKYRRSGPFDPEEAFRLLQQHGVTNLFAPPTAFRMMAKLEQVREKYPLRALRICTSAGEPLNPEVVDWGQRELGLRILDGYGQTEGIMMATNFPHLPAPPGSMGRPAPGVRLRIATPEGKASEPGQPGEIQIHKHTPLLFQQYWKNPAQTAQSYVGDWYRTGDSAWQDGEGYLHFVGRTDDVIISAGYRIGPFEVESSILEHPAVAESAVVAKPDPERLRGHIVKAYVVLKEGSTPTASLQREIQELVRKRLSQSEYPREVEFVAELPKTRSGKIMRKQLRHRAQQEFARTQPPR
ncbi:MAG: acyl-CoA synthetase [Terriglobia bacterium]